MHHSLILHSYQQKDLHGLQKSVFVRGLGISMLELFQPIYLLISGLSLSWLMLFYLSQWISATLFCFVSGQISIKLGFGKTMLSGLASLSIYLVFFTLAPYTNYLTLFPAALAWGYYQAVYWPNYHHYFCGLTKSSSRGSQTGLIVVAQSISRFAAPFLGGLIITMLGFPVMFAVAIVAVLLSGYPFLKAHTGQSIINESPKVIWADLTAKKHRVQQIIFFSLGVIWLVGGVVWPVFVYKYFTDLSQMGLFTSGVILLSILTTFFLSRIIDYSSQFRLLAFGNVIYTFGWILRSLVFNKFSFMVADSFTRIGENLTMIPVFSLMYDLREHQDKTSFQLQRTIAISLGSAFPALVVVLFPQNMLQILLAATPVFCLLLFLVKKT